MLLLPIAFFEVFDCFFDVRGGWPYCHIRFYDGIFRLYAWRMLYEYDHLYLRGSHNWWQDLFSSTSNSPILPSIVLSSILVTIFSAIIGRVIIRCSGVYNKFKVSMYGAFNNRELPDYYNTLVLRALAIAHVC